MTTAHRAATVFGRLLALRTRTAAATRVRHRATDAIAVMAFSAAVSGALALLLTGLTWWTTRSGEMPR